MTSISFFLLILYLFSIIICMKALARTWSNTPTKTIPFFILPLSQISIVIIVVVLKLMNYKTEWRGYIPN